MISYRQADLKDTLKEMATKEFLSLINIPVPGYMKLIQTEPTNPYDFEKQFGSLMSGSEISKYVELYDEAKTKSHALAEKIVKDILIKCGFEDDHGNINIEYRVKDTKKIKEMIINAFKSDAGISNVSVEQDNIELRITFTLGKVSR